MLKTLKKKIHSWKLTAIAVTVAGFFILVACQDQVMNDVSEVVKSSTMALNVPSEIEERLTALKSSGSETSTFVAVEITEENKVSIMNETLKKYDEKAIASMSVIKNAKHHGKETNRNFVILEVNEKIANLTATSTNDQNEQVFIVCEETAHPKGGLDTFMQFLSNNIKYPDEALEKKVEGHVYVEFIVEKDGTLTNLKIQKGIGHGCDEEVLRVMTLAEPWEPGKQRDRSIRQRMILPVVFSAGKGNTN